MRLGRAAQSVRPCAWINELHTNSNGTNNRKGRQKQKPLTTETTELHRERHREMRERHRGLLIAQRLYGIELGRARRRIQAGQQADQKGESERENHEPPRYRPEVFRRKALARKINVSTEVDDAADQPAERYE